jgi:predicted N-acetyltransferase YhbS
MTDADIDGAVGVWQEAFSTMAARYGLLQPPRSPASDQRLAARMRHFLATDPEGSFVADDDGTVVGLSQSLVREDYWMLSLLATATGRQGRGVGHGLLELALGNAPRDSPGTIQSSRDPAAMALYTLAGFSLHPALTTSGRVRQGAVASDPRVRHGGPDDLALVDEIDRSVRGSARGVDIAAMLAEPGVRLLVIEGGGYAVAQDERVITMGARDEEGAVGLLRTALAEMAPTASVEMAWLTGSQQWAIRTVVSAGLELHPYGAVMVRGMAGPPFPYIPSGGYG